MQKRQTLIIFWGDIVILYGTLALTLLLRGNSGALAHAWSLHVVPFTIVFIAWVAIFYIAGLYDTETLATQSALRDALMHQEVLPKTFLSAHY